MARVHFGERTPRSARLARRAAPALRTRPPASRARRLRRASASLRVRPLGSLPARLQRQQLPVQLELVVELERVRGAGADGGGGGGGHGTHLRRQPVEHEPARTHRPRVTPHWPTTTATSLSFAPHRTGTTALQHSRWTHLHVRKRHRPYSN